jgi:hypothetical protein
LASTEHDSNRIETFVVMKMGSVTAGPYNPYDPGVSGEIFTTDPSDPVRRVGEDPPPSPGGLLGILALGLGYWAMRQSLAPTTPTGPGASTAQPSEGSSKENLANQRRVSGLTDGINGGVGQVTQNGPATVNRATQLAGLPNGGLTLGQQTQFPPIAAGVDVGNLPAVLRGATVGQTFDAAPWLTPANKGTAGWQDFALPRALFDDLAIPEFLRRAKENKDEAVVQPDKQGLKATGSGGGTGGGKDGDVGSGGNDDDCKEERETARKICGEAQDNDWKSNFRVGPYPKKYGGPWTVEDCMNGLVSNACGGADPFDPENWNKLARRPGPSRRR